MRSSGRLSFTAILERGAFRLEARFDVEAGETLVLVGPNGAGKSSCLEILAGLVLPESGRIRFGEEIWLDTDRGWSREPHLRQVGLVPQDAALFPHLSVRGNVEYGARARGGDRTSAREQGLRWMRRLGIDMLAERNVRELSGGQRQRVALARALASGAKLLLLDEPFAALDVTARAEVRADLRRILRDVDLPCVLVTHDATDALILGDRIAAFSEGRIVQSGSPGELLLRPATSFVSELVHWNLVRAELSDAAEDREAAAFGLTFHVISIAPPGAAFLTFDPSSVVVSQERPAGSARNVFPGEVKSLFALPDRTRIIVDIGGEIAADLTRGAVEELGIVPGRRVWLAVKSTAIQVHSL